MGKMNKVADLCWEGLTLKHVSHKGIFIPYVLFFIMVFLFELFLTAMLMVSAYLVHSFGYRPNFQYYVCAAILLLMLVLTVPVILATIKASKS